jgi:hypothetical protein
VAVAVVVDMVQALAQSLVLVAVVAVAAIAPAIISNLALVIHALQVIHAHPEIHVRQALIVLLTHALHALRTHVLLVAIALVTHVRLLVHVLLNPKLVVNVETLAAVKYDSPTSSPFCMESSRFR